MVKDTNKSAAGLRRSAIAERLRLREEWSALKEIDSNALDEVSSQRNITKKHQHGNIVIRFPKKASNSRNVVSKKLAPIHERACETGEVLRGVVVHVDVVSESKALALRAALMALGASVVPKWSNLVTHLVWSEGGCRDIRAKARLFACKLVSPLWVEACAAAGRRLPEAVFPAATRPSDLPSPSTLKLMLKRLEHENLSLQTTSEESDKQPRLRISTDSDENTTNRSGDKSEDRSKDQTKDVHVNVNTATRRLLPLSPEPTAPPARCKRKLFTHREPDTHSGSDMDEDQTPAKQKTPQKTKPVVNGLVRKIIGINNVHTLKDKVNRDKRLRIVLTGMSRQERQEVIKAIKQLNGKVQSAVNRKTTHILLGKCEYTQNYCNKCNSPEKLLSQMLSNVNIEDNRNRIICKCACNGSTDINRSLLDQNSQPVSQENVIVKPRTVKTLLGAVRGCRVLYSRWVLDSLKERRWIHHIGYEVKHLKKIFEKARVERFALQKMHTEYAYNVFNGAKIRISQNADHKDAITQLLTLCGAQIQNGGNDADITIGTENGEICSKWVFDSITAARLRTKRRYINRIPTEVVNLSQ